MADAYTRAQAAQFLGGALDTFAQYGLQQLYRKNEQERLATMEVAGQMAEQGMLDTLPDDVWKRMAKNMGQNYSDLLMQRNSIRKQMLGPLRTIQKGVAQSIQQPVYDLVPGQQMQQGERPMGDTLDEQYGPSSWPANRPPATQRGPITVGSQAQLQTLQQRAAQQAQVTGQPNALEGYQIRSRNPTAIEQFQRADQLSPFGVALLTHSTELGTLAATGQTNRMRQLELDYKWSKLAADRDEPTFGSITKIVGDDGKVQEVWPKYTQTGGIEYIPIGEGEQGDAMRRTIQEMQKVQTKMAEPGISSAQYDKLNERYEMLKQVFAKQTHTRGGSEVSVQLQVPVYDQETGQWIMPDQIGAAGGDKTYNRGMAEAYRDLNIGGRLEWQYDRGIMTSGNLALQTLKRLYPLTTPSNVGVLGGLKRFTLATAGTIRGGPELYQSVMAAIQGQAPDLINQVNVRESSPGFKQRLRSALNDADMFAATLATLAAIKAKFDDPITGIREQEFNRNLKQLQAGGFTGSVSNLSELESSVRSKMLISQSQLQRATQYAQAHFGAPPRPENAPLDYALDFSVADRIFPGPEISMPGSAPQGGVAPQQQQPVQPLQPQQPVQPQPTQIPPVTPGQPPRTETGEINAPMMILQEMRAMGVNIGAMDLDARNQIWSTFNQWYQQNPDATPQEIRATIRRILKRGMGQ